MWDRIRQEAGHERPEVMRRLVLWDARRPSMTLDLAMSEKLL
jgi:hypothetical protein